MIGLESINIGGSPITDAGLRHLAGLTNLTTLHLRSTNITDAGLDLMKSFENLENLNVVLCGEISDGGIRSFQQAMPNCKVRR